MKPSKKGSALVVVLLVILVILIIAGVWLLNTNRNKYVGSPQVTSSSTLQYNNTTIGLGFDYPSGWTTQDCNNSVDPVTHGDLLGPNGKMLSSFVMSIVPPSGNSCSDIVGPSGVPSINLDHTLLNLDDQPIQDQWKAITCPPNYPTCQNLTNQNGVKYTLSIEGPDRGGGYQLSALVPTGKYVLAVSLNLVTTSTDTLINPTGTDAIGINVLDQILSTLELR